MNCEEPDYECEHDQRRHRHGGSDLAGSRCILQLLVAGEPVIPGWAKSVLNAKRGFIRLFTGLLIALAAAGITHVSHAGSVSSASPMLEPRSGHTATLLQDGRVLIAGGMRRDQDFHSSAEQFDPAAGESRPR